MASANSHLAVLVLVQVSYKKYVYFHEATIIKLNHSFFFFLEILCKEIKLDALQMSRENIAKT